MKNVIIYSTPACMYCHMAKEWFKEKNINYTEHDISTNAQKRDEMIQKTGSMAVPVIEIEGETIVGFDKNKISKILGI